jgi:CrcB protein
MNTALVMLGGALGAAARYHLAGLFGRGFPWGTLAVNLAGCFLIAIVVARFAEGEPWRLFLAVGLLGGFTTFSAFALETVELIDGGRIAAALLYVLASVAGGLIAFAGGHLLVRAA